MTTIARFLLLAAALLSVVVGQEGGDVFYKSDNGVTVVCPKAEVGDTGIVDGVTYTKRSEEELRSIVAGGPSEWAQLTSTCTSGITNMSGLFYYSTYGLDIQDSPLTNFNQDISTWDTGDVNDMSYMFAFASFFNSPLGDWDTKSVRDMSFLFAYASAFNQPIERWDTRSVVDMEYMFAFSKSFNEKLGAWDITSVEDMNHMFVGAKAFNQPLNGWDTSAVEDMSFVFSDASLFDQPIDTWDTGKVKEMTRMFYNARTFNQDLSTWCVESAENFDFFSTGSAMETAYLPPFGTDANCGEAELPDGQGQNTSEEDLFYLASNGVTVKCPDAVVGSTGTVRGIEYTKRSEEDIRALIAGGASRFPLLVTTCTSGVEDMSGFFDYEMYDGFESSYRGGPLGDFNENIASWDTSNVKTMRSMLAWAKSFNQPIGSWNTSRVEDMSYMLIRAKSFNQDIKNWNTRKVTTMAQMFNGADAFNKPIDSWNTGQVEDMSFMLASAGSFNQPLETWDTGNVKIMNHMFYNARAFNQDISTWCVGSVQNNQLFATGSPLESSPSYLPPFDTFENCGR